jgi:hypothetical protein
MLIFEKEYQGFEDASDLQRDIIECLDPDFNPKAKEIEPEFQGIIKVTIEYVAI